MTPLICILMPVRNSENTLPRVIEGIFNLNYPKNRIRLVFVDDASTDASSRILEQFLKKNGDKYSSYQFIRNETHDGVRNIPRARNLCLKYFQGDYLLFLDSDVVLPNDAVRILLDEVKEDVLITCLPYAYSEKEIGLKLRKAEIDIHLGATLMHPKAIEVIGGKFNEKYKETDDIWTYYLLKKGGYRFVPVERRCLHLKPFSYLKHLKYRFLELPKTHVYLFRDRLVDRKWAMRWIFYLSYLIVFIYFIVDLTSNFPINFISISLWLFLIVNLVGLVYYRGLRFFWALPIGLIMTIGLPIAFIRLKGE